jgi:hypothetical protein
VGNEEEEGALGEGEEENEDNPEGNEEEDL